MNDYKIQLDKYHEFLEENKYIINKLLESNDRNKLEIILNPKSINQIKVGYLVIRVYNDIFSLINNIINSEEKAFKSEIIDIYVNIINALKNNDVNYINRIKKYLETINPKEKAKLVYELLILVFTNIESVIDEISKKCNFDLNNRDENEEFSILFKEANNITNFNNKYDVNKMNLEDEKEVDDLVLFADEFHALCIK